MTDCATQLRVVTAIATVSEANRREHWAAKARRVKSQRGAACMVLRAADRIGVRELCRVAPGVVVELVRVGRRLDDDNLRGALKAVRDGVADWLGWDDGDPRYEWRYAQRSGKVGVEITVTPQMQKADPDGSAHDAG